MATLATALAVGLSGCRTTEKDVHRWANTVQGPKKLVAVVKHAKYPMELRVEAAMTLVQMRPRGGKRLGILGDDDNQGLVETLALLPEAERSEIVTRMVPRLVAEMNRPPPKLEGAAKAPADPSFPFKDAAFALLTYNDGALVTQEGNRHQLEQALADWTMVNFAARADESSQMYGTEQILKYLKADGVRRLPELIQPDARKIDMMAQLVAELGDQKTKLRASRALVRVAADVQSDSWLERKKPDVQRANRASKLNPTSRQFEAQLSQYQEEELLRVFTSMKRVGGKPIADYLLAFAEEAGHTDKRRAAALAALEGHIDRKNRSQVGAILKLAKADATPDQVRDQALRRVGELPRELVVDELYSLFTHRNWKIRWMAAELVLQMSETRHVAQFMDRLSHAEGMALTEAWRYGTLLGQMKGDPKPSTLAREYATRDHPIQARVSALGYYFEHGKQTDLPHIVAYERDDMRVPQCTEGAQGCEWKCTVGEGKQAEVKDVTTVGEYVNYCVVPALKRRDKDGKQTQNPAPQKD